MPIEYVVESLDQVEESVRSAYVEADGKFQLDADKYAEAKAAGLKRKNSELLGKEKALKETLAKLERFKDVPDEDWDAFQDYRQAQQAGGDNPGKVNATDLEKAMAREKTRFERQVAERDAALKDRETRISDLEKQIREYSLWTPVKDWAIEAGVKGDRLDAFMTVMRAQKRFDFDEGGKEILFLNADGTPTLQKPKEALKTTLMNEYPWAFAASDVGGSGARNGTQSGRAGVDYSKMSATERIRAARESGVKQ